MAQMHARTGASDVWAVLAAVALSYVIVIYGVPTIGFSVGVLLDEPQEIGGALGASAIWVTIIAVLCSPAILLTWGVAILVRAAVRRRGNVPESIGSRKLRLTSLTMCRYWVWLTTVVVGFGSLFGTYAGLAPLPAARESMGLTGPWVGAGVLAAAYTVLSIWLVQEESRRTVLRLWLPFVVCSLVLPAVIRWILLAV